MTVKSKCVSSCCGAEMRVEGGDDKHPLACTMYNVCSSCGQPCNWQTKEPNLCISQWDKKAIEEAINEQIEIDIVPTAKPRMTRRDKWAKRPCVMRYRAFKDELILKSKGFELGDSFDITFIIPFPKSTSKKRRKMFNGMPHQIRPDYDNLLKSVCDSFYKEDAHIWKVYGRKLWGEKGKIIIENLDDFHKPFII